MSVKTSARLPERLLATGFRQVSGQNRLGYYYHVPATGRANAPVIVCVHGISRNAAEHLMRLRDMADRCGAALLAPCFGQSEFPGYQRLACRNGERADLALLAMLNDFAALSGCDTGRILLMGFSGGGQFAHRFAMFHADRVAHCICIAAGWYSWPDRTIPFPLGTGEGGFPAGVALHPQWDKVPVHVIVGSRDNGPEPSLNNDPEISNLQGQGRYQRARNWAAALRKYRAGRISAPVTIETITHFGHDFGKAVERFALDRRVAAACGLLEHEEKMCA